jgi:hypothetical protein
MRAVEPAESDARSGGERPAIENVRCTYRPSDADFYCWKFGVWYNLMDCCERHHDETYSGCADCGQGRSNLKQNIERFQEHRWRFTGLARR